MATTDPPAYAKNTSRSITDLRNQILANGKTLKPLNHESLELIVAKIHSDGPNAAASSSSDNKVYAELAAATASNPGKHYAVLLIRSLSERKVRVVIKGLPRDTVEEALGK